LPEDAPEFDKIQKCFDAIGLPYELQDGLSIGMEKFVNHNNVFFQCKDDRERDQKAIVNACNALHRIILNFQLIGDIENEF